MQGKRAEKKPKMSSPQTRKSPRLEENRILLQSANSAQDKGASTSTEKPLRIRNKSPRLEEKRRLLESANSAQDKGASTSTEKPLRIIRVQMAGTQTEDVNLDFDVVDNTGQEDRQNIERSRETSHCLLIPVIISVIVAVSATMYYYM